ncbi:hypothetical protein B0H10DRAFT_2236540 [Mycena sp. CBHHK59/15]|nr:hypothetical protein B0H10DRAFT_2236540 [Mycena sp. CBHHK59/15]
MKPKPQASRGHQYFVGCSGWTTKFGDGHRTHSIPDHVDEDLVANALAGLPVTNDPSKDTPSCSGIIHSHTGGKKRNCSHAHIINRMQVQGRIQNYPCDAKRTIYIPKDLSIRKVLIIHNETGHNHPMPMLNKISFAFKDTYWQCIRANGVLGATVAKIDNAQSTKWLLGGKTPAAHAPPLHNKRAKRDILHAEKLEKYPNGLGVDAILPMYHAKLLKPLPERYIHSYIKSPKGEIIIITFVPYLLMLLNDTGVTSFDGDTTYKGIEGEMNEWELTVFAKVVQRAASRVKLMVTGKPLPFKILVRGGNILVVNFDIDAPQTFGLCRSALKFSDPEYSGIPKDTPPEKLAPKLIKVCWRHGKEPVNEFSPLVSEAEFMILKNVFYIDSKESLDSFSAFVDRLDVKKITDWWRHKQMHAWIIPCLIKSQSEIPAEVWDSTPSTTNTNEAQHHWTNSLTGIKLTPVEALESRREVDENVAHEIKMSLRTGILSNPNNELSHRMARNSQRQSAAACKAHESREAADTSAELRRQLEAEAEKRRASTLLTKSLKAQLKAAKDTSGKQGKSSKTPAILTASSSGHVKGRRARAEPQILVDSIQSDSTSIPVPASTTAPPLPPTTLPIDHAFATVAPLQSEFSSVEISTDPAFNFLGGLDWNFNVPMGFSGLESQTAGSLFPMQDVSDGVLSTFDPTFFGLAPETLAQTETK